MVLDQDQNGKLMHGIKARIISRHQPTTVILDKPILPVVIPHKHILRTQTKGKMDRVILPQTLDKLQMVMEVRKHQIMLSQPIL
jgi:hypothetical protein